MKNVIFLPGFVCDERLFSHQMATLSRDFNTKVIVCKTSNNMQGHIDDVLNQAPDKFILVGHSFGGWIAQWIAIQAPQRVSKLILIGAN